MYALVTIGTSMALVLSVSTAYADDGSADWYNNVTVEGECNDESQYCLKLIAEPDSIFHESYGLKNDNKDGVLSLALTGIESNGKPNLIMHPGILANEDATGKASNPIIGWSDDNPYPYKTTTPPYIIPPMNAIKVDTSHRYTVLHAVQPELDNDGDPVFTKTDDLWGNNAWNKYTDNAIEDVGLRVLSSPLKADKDDYYKIAPDSMELSITSDTKIGYEGNYTISVRPTSDTPHYLTVGGYMDTTDDVLMGFVLETVDAYGHVRPRFLPLNGTLKFHSGELALDKTVMTGNNVKYVPDVYSSKSRFADSYPVWKLSKTSIPEQQQDETGYIEEKGPYPYDEPKANYNDSDDTDESTSSDTVDMVSGYLKGLARTALAPFVILHGLLSAPANFMHALSSSENSTHAGYNYDNDVYNGGNELSGHNDDHAGVQADYNHNDDSGDANTDTGHVITVI